MLWMKWVEKKNGVIRNCGRAGLQLTWILDMENLVILVVSMAVLGSDVGPQGPR